MERRPGPLGMVLLELKRRLYLYVAIDAVAALLAGHMVDLSGINMRPIGVAAVFIMLYPMLTGLIVERVRRAGRNYRLIGVTLFYAYIVASATAYVVSRSILSSYPDVAFALVMVGAIPCSNMLIGWAGIADASVEDALVIAVAGLLLIPILSPILIRINGGVFVHFSTARLFEILLAYIIIPLALGLWTRRIIIKRRGMKYFMSIRRFLPGVSATGILLIVFFSVAKVARIVVGRPVIFLLVLAGLLSYYAIQTLLSIAAAKLMNLGYEQGLVLILGATASSQAISLSVAATMFSALTVFALSFKPIIQVLYILFLIYYVGPKLKAMLGSESLEK